MYWLNKCVENLKRTYDPEEDFPSLSPELKIEVMQPMLEHYLGGRLLSVNLLKNREDLMDALDDYDDYFFLQKYMLKDYYDFVFEQFCSWFGTLKLRAIELFDFSREEGILIGFMEDDEFLDANAAWFEKNVAVTGEEMADSSPEELAAILMEATVDCYAIVMRMIVLVETTILSTLLDSMIAQAQAEFAKGNIFKLGFICEVARSVVDMRCFELESGLLADCHNPSALSAGDDYDEFLEEDMSYKTGLL